MAGHIEALSGVAGGAAQDPIRMANPGAVPGQEQGLSISSVAEQALGSLGTFQNGFTEGVAPSQSPTTAISEVTRSAEGAGVPEGHAQDSSVMLMEQIQASTSVQTQLVSFVMASSVSSSLGRNLNMFLRGQ